MKDLDQVKKEILEAAKIVGSTFGPNGRNVLIQAKNPYFTQDGATVANELKKYRDDLGTRLLVDASSMVAHRAGDGTTTTCLLVALALEHDVDLWEYQEQYKRYVEDVTLEADEEIVIHGAITSSKDVDMGTVIGQAVWDLGPDGYFRAQVGTEFDVKVIPGYEMDGGMLLPQAMRFQTNPHAGVTNNNGSLSLKNPMILIVNHTITGQDQLTAIMKKYAPGLTKNELPSRPLVIVNGDIDEKPIQYIAWAQSQGIPVFLVQPPPLKEDLRLRRAILEDLKVITGCDHVYEKTSGRVIDRRGGDFTGKFGQADHVDIYERYARFQCPGTAIEDRKAQVRAEQGDEEMINKRLSCLSGASGVITLGAATQAEYENQNLRVEDAVRTAQAILQEGYVKGGPAFWGQLQLKFENEPVSKVFGAMAKMLPKPLVSPTDSAMSMRLAFETAASLIHQLKNAEHVIK